MPKDKDEGFEFGGENRATNNLAKSIKQLAEVLEKLLCQLQTNSLTKDDLRETEGRVFSAINDSKGEILKAFGERVDPAAIKELKETSGELKAAVEANTPVSGS